LPSDEGGIVQGSRPCKPSGPRQQESGKEYIHKNRPVVRRGNLYPCSKVNGKRGVNKNQEGNTGFAVQKAGGKRKGRFEAAENPGRRGIKRAQHTETHMGKSAEEGGREDERGYPLHNRD